MAYASRRFIKHIDDYDRVHRLEIQQLDYAGSESSIKANKGSGAFKFEHEDVTDEDDYLKVYANPIQKGMLEVYPVIQDSTDYALLTDIFQSDEDEFRLVWKIDGSVFWTGYVLNDLLEFEESSYPYTSTIVAKDFSRLKGMDYALNDTRQTWITTIADLLSNLDLGLDIETATSWTESHLDSSLTGDYDYLNHIYHETKALREFGRTGDEDPQPISVYQALERVLSDNCLILKQIGGKYQIDHLSAYKNPSSVLVSTYDSTGTQTAQTTIDKTLAYNRNTMRVKSNGSKSKGFVAIKRAKVKFEHRNKISGILFPEETEFTDSESKQFEEPFISDGTQTFRLTGLVRALMRTGATDASASLDIRIVRSGQADYYLDPDYEWVTSGTSMADLELVDMGGDVWQKGFDILTGETPADADGVLRITISSATASNTMPAVAHTTFWRDMALEIRNINNSTYSNFQLTQPDGYSEKYEHAKTWFGDGPNSFSVSALRYSSADGDITTESWQRRGTTTGYRYYHENVLKEIVDIQRTFVFRKEAAMWGLYDATKVLQYRSGNYYYTGGSFAGATGDWNVRIMDVNVQTNTTTDDFKEILKYADEGVESSTPSSPPSEGVGGVSDHGELGGLGDPSDHPWAMQTDFSNVADWTPADNRFFQIGNNLSEGTVTSMQTNLGLTDGSANLDFNSLNIGYNSGNGSLQFDRSDGSNTGYLGINSSNNLFLRTTSGDSDLLFQSNRNSAIDTLLTLDGATGDALFSYGIGVPDGADITKYVNIKAVSGDTPLEIEANNSTNLTHQLFEDQSGSGALALSSVGTQNVRLTSRSGQDSYINAGNFGIGTTTPGALLDVDGNAYVDGTLNIGYNAGNEQILLNRSDGNASSRIGVNASDNMFLRTTGWAEDILFQANVGGNGIVTAQAIDGATGDSLFNYGIGVDGIATFKNSVAWTTPTFNTGFLGNGSRLYEDASEYHFETDVGFFRSALFAQEFIINQILATQGSRIAGPGRGKVETVVSGTSGSEVVEVSDPEGNQYAAFAVNDLILCLQVRNDLNTETTNVLTDTGGVIVKRYVRQVTDVTGNQVTFSTPADAPADAAGPAQGDVIVAFGNTTDTSRQNLLYETVIEPNSPYTALKTGIDSWTAYKAAGNLQMKYGNLNQSYGYTTDTFGMAVGPPSGDHATFDPTNGVRFIDGSGTVGAQFNSSVLTLGTGSNFVTFDVSAGTGNIELDSYVLSTTGLSIDSTVPRIDVGSSHYLDGSTDVASFSGGILQANPSTVDLAGFTADANNLTNQSLTIGTDLTFPTSSLNIGTTPSGGHYVDVRGPNSGDAVQMVYTSTTNWGIGGYLGGNAVFQLGSSNRIASSYFDPTDLWGGDPSKANASLRFDFANSDIIVGTGGEIRNSGSDYWINEDGIELERGLVGKGGTSIGRSLSWQFSTGADKAAYITTYANDSTPTLNDMNLWIAAGYDDSAQQGVGSIQLDAGTIRLDAKDDIVIGADTLDLLATNISVPTTFDVSNGTLRIPVHSDATRPANPEPGELIYNTDASTVQVGNNSGGWKPL